MTPADAAARRILILDFGSQYTQLIARRVREAGVYSEILPWDAEPADIRAFGPAGVILSGGPESVISGATFSDVTPVIPALVFELGVPVLGICYGMQSMAAQLGGEVESSAHREFGLALVKAAQGSALLDGVATDDMSVWMSHGDRVKRLPPGFRPIASSANAPLAGMADEARRFYGLQFHPEVTHTEQGQRIIERFVRDICACPDTWRSGNIIAREIAKVRAQVGSDKVLLGLSGGVDSSVVAALLHEALGDQLFCVFVDTGLLRLHEGDQVMDIFAEHLGVTVIRVNAEQRFLKALAGVEDPEAKRKVIGRLFVEVFDEEAGKLRDVKWLAQGTIYPDVIESAGTRTGKAHVIKSHHNVGGLPENMQLKLVEPIRELFKDEVRRVGVELGLPREMVYRHPFPGPGLGVRILGEVKKEYADLLRKADHIFIEELRRADLYDNVSQAFAVFLPVRSVGVMGDGRTYDHAIAVRCVTSRDAMTADWAHVPHELLGRISSRITNEVSGINRVVYDISSKPPATIEWE